MTRHPDSADLALHEFLRSEHEAIMEEWRRRGLKEIPSAGDLSEIDHLNHMPKLLTAIADQVEEAAGQPLLHELSLHEPKVHAEQRWDMGFSLAELTREYSLMRTITFQRLDQRIGDLTNSEVVFLNQALDKAVELGVLTYVARANEQLENKQERLAVTLRSIGDGVISTDADGCIEYLNPAAEQITGWSAKEAIEKPIGHVLVMLDEGTREPLASLTEVATDIDGPARHTSNTLLRRADGELRPAEEIAAPLRNKDGDLLGAVSTFRDVSNVRALTLELGYLAAHDSLTGLPNRTLFQDRLQQELAHAVRHKMNLAILYLDLDLFKDVNDAFGHSVGDELLQQVAGRLQAVVRRDDTVSRLGGDEFAILLSEVDGPAFVSDVASKVSQELKKPYTIGTETLVITTSIGVSVYPDDGDDPQTLIKQADVAMYQAKAQGRDCIKLFTPRMNTLANERQKLQSDLRNALEANELTLFYQPQIALKSVGVIGAEALLRWRHPTLGTVFPARFIPVAESSHDIMVAIGKWALDQACWQAMRWLEAGHCPLRVSVNISLVQLQQENLVDFLGELLHRCQLPASLLQLELTESVLMSDVQGAAAQIKALQKMGLGISVDDFGTSYSSLGYLKDLPVNEIKIDRTFVSDIDHHQSNAAIVQAVIQLGKSLDLRVVAEGVEDQFTVDFLAANGCENAQGFYYSRAIAGDAFEREFIQRSH